MVNYEIFGRETGLVNEIGLEGCGYLGKLVSYPGGRYEEIGSVFMDLTSPHCILVLGKRGTGKSYTLGVLAENFAMLKRKYRERISVIIIDTMSVFHSLKVQNHNRTEIAMLKDFNNMKPTGLGDFARIIVPKLAIDMLKENEFQISYDGVLEIPFNLIEPHDWLTLFGLSLTEPLGTHLIRAYDRLEERTFSTLYEAIETTSDSDASAQPLLTLFHTLEGTGLFSNEKKDITDLSMGGKLSILDISSLKSVGGFDLRNLVVSVLARHLLHDRTVYSTIEMQSEAGLIDTMVAKNITEKHPIVYMMIDEAHLFLPKDRTTLSSDVLIDWIKLGRHPGLSLILATQEPSALHESAIRQSDMIISHNITASDDVEALGKAKQSYMKGDNDIQKIVSTMESKRGLAVIFDDRTQKVEMCRIRPRLSLHAGIDASALRD